MAPLVPWDPTTTCRSRVSTRSTSRATMLWMASGLAVASSSPQPLDDEPVPVEQDDLLALARDCQQIGLDLGPEPPVLGVGEVAPLVLLSELLHSGPEGLPLPIAGAWGRGGEATPQLGSDRLDGVRRQDGGHEPRDDLLLRLPGRTRRSRTRPASLRPPSGGGRPRQGMRSTTILAPANPGVAAHPGPARAADQPPEGVRAAGEGRLCADVPLARLDPGHGVRVLLSDRIGGSAPAGPRRPGGRSRCPGTSLAAVQVLDGGRGPGTEHAPFDALPLEHHRRLENGWDASRANTRGDLRLLGSMASVRGRIGR